MESYKTIKMDNGEIKEEYIMYNKSKIVEPVSSLMLILYPCLYMFFNNIGEAHFVDILSITVIFIGIGIFLFLLLYIFLKEISKTVFTLNIILFIFFNFKMLEDSINSIFHSFYYWHMIIIYLFIIINVILLFKQNTFQEISRLNKLVAVVYSILLCISIGQAVPKIIDLKSKKQEIQNSENQLMTSREGNTFEDKPNFYYLIFDEYGGPENLKYFMNFDNKDFYSKLEKMGCNVSYTSRNNDIVTAKIVADLVNLKKVSYDGMTNQVSQEYRVNPPLIRLFKEYGYKLNKITNDPIGSATLIDYQNKLEKATTETAHGMIIGNTMLYPINFNISDNYVNNLNKQIQYMYDSIKLESNGILSIAHFNLPHLPFVFDKNGNKNPNFMYRDVVNDEVYLNQLHYTNIIIEKFIKKIIENDPTAIVLIQSDHGCRNVMHRYEYLNETKPNNEQIKYMKSILNILYYKGEKIDIENLSGYDTLKLVVNKILNVDIK